MKARNKVVGSPVRKRDAREAWLSVEHQELEEIGMVATEPQAPKPEETTFYLEFGLGTVVHGDLTRH